MFTNTSWTDYFAAVVALLITYYLIIGIKFYLPELRKTFSDKRKPNEDHVFDENDLQDSQLENPLLQDNQPDLHITHKNYLPAHQETEDLFEQVQGLTSQLKEAISVAVSKKYVKEEFIVSLRLLLQKYKHLKSSPFMVPINNLIASECEKHSYVQLNAEERVMLWNE